MLPRFLVSVGASDALLEETDAGISEAVRDTVRPIDLNSSPAVASIERVLPGAGSEWLPKSPRNGLRDLLRRRGMCDERGSEDRCMADVDCDKGDGTFVL